MSNFFPGTSSFSVVLFPEAPSITGLEHIPHQVRCITTPMLYHYATAVVDILLIKNIIDTQIHFRYIFSYLITKEDEDEYLITEKDKKPQL